MENSSKTTEVVNDLIKINNDRIEGYQKAIAEIPAVDADLKVLFSNMVEQSQTMKIELQQHLNPGEDRVEDETTTSGKIYRGWMDIKKAFAFDDRKAILESCEYGEDAAQKAYRNAQEEEGLSANTQMLISNQKNQLLTSHDKVKQLRDQARNM